MSEALLVLQPGLSATARQACLDAVRRHGVITARMGLHLCVVRSGPQEQASLLAVPGVQSVIGHDAAGAGSVAALPPGLDDAERLFVAGWLAQGSKDGPRPGAGQDWDAPGFAPPDSP